MIDSLFRFGNNVQKWVIKSVILGVNGLNFLLFKLQRYKLSKRMCARMIVLKRAGIAYLKGNEETNIGLARIIRTFASQVAFSSMFLLPCRSDRIELGFGEVEIYLCRFHVSISIYVHLRSGFRLFKNIKAVSLQQLLSPWLDLIENALPLFKF